MTANNGEKTVDKKKEAQFKKGNTGRQKGTPNKFTNLKQAFLDVFERIEKESEKNDSVKSFYEWVLKNDRNRGMFYQLISKMLPANLTLDGDMKLTYIVSEKVLPEVNEEEDD